MYRTLAPRAALTLASVCLVACLFACTRRNPDICCKTDEECTRLGLASPISCELGVCVDNACTSTVNACDGDEDCGDGTGFCVDRTCVACRQDASCPTTAPICDEANHACRGCAKDSECASMACDAPAGRCVDESSILYASVIAGPLAECSRAAPCTLRRAAEVLSEERSHIVLEPGTHTSGAVFDAKKGVVVGTGATIEFTGDHESLIRIQNNSSIKMRDLTVLYAGPRIEKTVAIVLVHDSELALENIHGNTLHFYTVIAENSKLEVDNSIFSFKSISVSGRAIIDRSTFLREAPFVGGVIQLTNSVIISESAQSTAMNGSTSASVANNTFISGTISCPLGQRVLQFHGNIFYNVTFGDLTNCIFAYNLLSSAVPDGTGNIIGDPHFVDAAAGNYRLMPGSPAIDAGGPIALNNGHDLEGRSRPQGAGPDMGAFEYVPQQQ